MPKSFRVLAVASAQSARAGRRSGISWNSHRRADRANMKRVIAVANKGRRRKDHDRRQSRRLADGHQAGALR